MIRSISFPGFLVSLVPKLHLGTQLRAQFHCDGGAGCGLDCNQNLIPAIELPGQVRSQMEFGNEENEEKNLRSSAKYPFAKPQGSATRLRWASQETNCDAVRRSADAFFYYQVQLHSQAMGKKVAPPALFAGGAVFTPQMPLRGISRSPKGNGGDRRRGADYQ